MPNTKIKELEAVVAKLHAEREGHVAAIAEIDAAFAELGISPGAAIRAPGKRRGRPPKSAGAKPAGRRKGKRGHRFPVSGTKSVYDFVAKAGEKGVTGKQIDEFWKSEGRAGSSYNILGQLVKKKQIKRLDVKGQRGSQYTAL
jgi:hypothetical protein